ncbi:MAG: NAD-binding protein, partial [Lachnospiraceae bacterium]|nr:NAD-binding protein [Lachnospiraceae bacterium]
MNIIIVGCGKVGYTLAEQLNNEDHNVVVVDIKEDRVKSVTNELDTMGV